MRLQLSSERTRIRASLGMAILTTVLATFVSSAFARTWYIKANGTGDAPTIQAGVDSALAGDVVLVAAGTYSATSTVNIGGTPTVVCVSIGKNIKLRSESGSSATTIAAATAKVCIYVHDVDSSAEIRGFKIQTQFEPYGCVTAARSSPMRDPLPSFLRRGITCQNGSPLIAANEITMNGVAIEFHWSPAQVTDNTITFAYYGVTCLDASNVLIANNLVHDCANCVWSEDSSPVVDRNQIYNGCTGIGVEASGAPVITNNYVHDTSPLGIECGTPSVTLEDNRIVSTNLAVLMNGATGTAIVRGNVFFNQYSGALSLSDDTGSITIEANTIDRVTAAGWPAIFCQAGSSPLIRRNIITRSPAGIRCESSSFPVFECNDVFLSQNRYTGQCVDQTGINGNISVDPQFCGVAGSGNFWLLSTSPCAAGNHPNGAPCGRIGAKDIGCTVIVGTSGPLARTTDLVSIVPNPFNPQTTITYSLALEGNVEINVYDVAGRLVRELVSGVEPIGPHSVNWLGVDLHNQAVGSGVYFVRMEFEGRTFTKKMILLK